MYLHLSPQSVVSLVSFGISLSLHTILYLHISSVSTVSTVSLVYFGLFVSPHNFVFAYFLLSLPYAFIFACISSGLHSLPSLSSLVQCLCLSTQFSVFLQLSWSRLWRPIANTEVYRERHWETEGDCKDQYYIMCKLRKVQGGAQSY